MWWGQNANFLKLLIQRKCCEIFNQFKVFHIKSKNATAIMFSAFLQEFKKCKYIPVENKRGLFQNCSVTKQENCFRVLDKKKKKKSLFPIFKVRATKDNEKNLLLIFVNFFFLSQCSKANFSKTFKLGSCNENFHILLKNINKKFASCKEKRIEKNALNE